MLLQKGLAVCARLGFLAAHLLNPGSLELGLQLAEIYRATGEMWKAVGVYESLIRSYPASSELFRKLGGCYEKMGAVDAARMCSDRVAVLEG